MLVLEKNSLTEEIEQLVNLHGTSRSSLLPILQDIQRKYKHISDFAQQEVARFLDIHPVEVYSLVTFYSFLNTQAKGRNIIRLCKTISCEMQNKESVSNAIERELGISFGETTKDKKVSLEYVSCLGLCDQGPALLVNEKVFPKMTAEKAVQILSELK
ncbi:MAG: NAD(P)H-dependent oxidoreductase subunit E [Chlorobiaceae bacterium]|nr:NAD(P)H-dependent oxidoreductase subunit E [Chlorobiaceae bacterium]MBA4309378.1 NAD(P)H-dependent oxidoreductase subunit E [Chlorobiaceae bacterium]